MTVRLDEARNELARFFKLTVELNSGLTMFSDYIDRAWHELLEDESEYTAFCEESCGKMMGHVPSGADNPIVEVEWIGEYEARYGTLPEAWFMDASGILDSDSYTDYLTSHSVVASWKCSPSTNCNSRIEPDEPVSQ